MTNKKRIDYDTFYTFMLTVFSELRDRNGDWFRQSCETDIDWKWTKEDYDKRNSFHATFHLDVGNKDENIPKIFKHTDISFDLVYTSKDLEGIDTLLKSTEKQLDTILGLFNNNLGLLFDDSYHTGNGYCDNYKFSLANLLYNEMQHMSLEEFGELVEQNKHIFIDTYHGIKNIEEGAKEERKKIREKIKELNDTYEQLFQYPIMHTRCVLSSMQKLLQSKENDNKENDNDSQER